MAHTAKRIAPGAYQALRDALPVVFWYRRPFKNFLHASLRENRELLVGLDFDDIKRIVADSLVDRLMADEQRYRDITLALMVQIAEFERFPDLEALVDAAFRIAQARAAVAELRRWTGKYSEELSGIAQEAARLAAARQQIEVLRRFSDDVERLRQEFLRLHAMRDPRARGGEFEGFLAELFGLFDMEPRLQYSLEHEQIDGSFSFDTDDYIVEARWRAEPCSRDHADVFAKKVQRKGKNALGLFVSVNGFTSDTLETYSEATPFMVMDGLDLMAVLEQRVRLDDLLRRKKRHANETGHCYFGASMMVG
jgi:hypothetical protein